LNKRETGIFQFGKPEIAPDPDPDPWQLRGPSSKMSTLSYRRQRRTALGGTMRVTGITANLPVGDIATARSFYMDYLGLTVEAFNLGWVANFRSPDGRVSVQLVTRDATAPLDSTISVHVGASVDEAYAEAKRRGYDIIHPLTDEPWGVRRFFVRAPDGNVINVVSHSDDE
jgi:predicted enzyme related to lactoylglutathione lyase